MISFFSYCSQAGMLNLSKHKVSAAAIADFVPIFGWQPDSKPLGA
jgi:hypothetical protein